MLKNYGVWHDENQQARVVDNTNLLQLSYKNKLVDEWDSLNVKRVELNITQLVAGQSQVVYSAVYNGIGRVVKMIVSCVKFRITDGESKFFRDRCFFSILKPSYRMLRNKQKKLELKFHHPINQ